MEGKHIATNVDDRAMRCCDAVRQIGHSQVQFGKLRVSRPPGPDLHFGEVWQR